MWAIVGHAAIQAAKTTGMCDMEVCALEMCGMHMSCAVRCAVCRSRPSDTTHMCHVCGHIKVCVVVCCMYVGISRCGL